jgi:hypothetical protein
MEDLRGVDCGTVPALLGRKRHILGKKRAGRPLLFGTAGFLSCSTSAT